ncbi:hypothetical protein BSU04_12130 [Caballeronia sordidicola]|uniref:Uncharacterized protein n=1 Tax=Caballeronia sordidicola TaxID=196367 RepID=A0A226X665_CABSO|nr:hypothetical protein BSU04_12130 [Caballeronia sordidicola]
MAAEYGSFASTVIFDWNRRSDVTRHCFECIGGVFRVPDKCQRNANELQTAAVFG